MEHLYYLQKNKRVFTFFLIGVFLPLLFTIFVVVVFRIELGQYFLSIFEKKTLDNLTSYHSSVKKDINTYFVKSVGLLETMGKSNHFNTSSAMDEELRFQLKLNPQFLTLGTIDKKGIVTHIVSDEPSVEALLGENLANRNYFIQALKTGKTFVSTPLIGSVSKIAQINISVPVFQNGKITSVICGFISLKKLSDDINFSAPSFLYDKYSVLVDSDGTILTGLIPEKKRLTTLKNREPLYDKLISSSEMTYRGDEYNFNAEKVIAMGEKINVADNRQILLLSFLKKSAYDSERTGLMYTIDKITIYLAFVWLWLNGLLFIIASALLYRHDKK